jgi:hypothetical protein
VAEVFDRYLDWCEKNRPARTFQWNRDHIQRFLDSFADASMAASGLKQYQVVEWVDGHSTLGDSHRRGAFIALQRPFNWADKLGYILANPLSGLELPETKQRENPMTPEDFATLVEHVKDQPFRDLLTFA